MWYKEVLVLNARGPLFVRVQLPKGLTNSVNSTVTSKCSPMSEIHAMAATGNGWVTAPGGTQR